MTSPTGALARVVATLDAATLPPAGVGIDLVDLVDVAQLVEAGGVAFLESAWTADELDDCEDSVEMLAARWAAKEAVMKALGEGLGQISPLDVEVRLDSDSGAPRVQLHRHALAYARDRAICEWFVSLCHENGWAVAIAIARREHPPSQPNPAAMNQSLTTDDEEG